MKLYHVSFGLQETKKLFTPRVPESSAAMQGEDTKTQRICFSPSIEKCIQAIECLPLIGESITIYTLEVEPNDDNLVSPTDLYTSGRVPDALESQEYWYLRDVTLTGEQKIVTLLHSEFSFAWSVIKVQDIIKIVQSMIDTNFLDVDLETFTSEDDANTIYRTFCQWLDRNGFYSLEDELYDRVAELPWAQLQEVTRVDTIPYNGTRFGLVVIDKQPHIAFANSVVDAVKSIGVKTDLSTIIYDYEEQTFCRSMPDGLHWFRCSDLKEITAPKKSEI